MAVNRRPDGRWRVQVYDAMTRKMRHVGYFDRKRDALLAERDEMARLTGRGETVGAFGRRWIADFPRPKASTNLHNGYAIRRFVDHYAARRMDDIDRPTAAAWARQRPGDVPALRALWGDAMREGVATVNPWSNLRRPGSRGRRDLQPGWLTAADVDALERAAADVHNGWGPVAAALIRTAAYAGLRAGEAFGLEWRDVDYQRGQLQIQRAVCSHTGALQPPKNGRPRTIALPDRVAFALRMIEGRHPAVVFPSPRGHRLRAPAWAYLWKPVRAAAGRPGMHLHELRHFCATQLVEAGLQPWQIAAQLGHTDGGRLVAEVYGHPSDDIARDAVRAAFGDAPEG